LLFGHFDGRLKVAPHFRDLSAKLTWDELRCRGFRHARWYDACCDRYRHGTKDPRDLSDEFLDVLCEMSRFLDYK
jgi:hypothetical protein